MEVRKESNGLKNSMVTREELAIINQFTKRALKEDEVYTFAVSIAKKERGGGIAMRAVERAAR